MKCRHCKTPLLYTFLDLGSSPPSNAYLSLEDLSKPEIYYPLKLMVCTECWLVQTVDYAKPDELFSPEYAYFSSTSSTWLNHAASYSEKIIRRLNLNNESFVIEIASNDGYLLKNFLKAGIPCLGVEPTESTASVAKNLGIPVFQEFFTEENGYKLANQHQKADLIIGNNVYAHVPDINDFTAGLKVILKPGGTITLEFPHLLRLIENNQFDTVYHEHFSYLSLYAVNRIFNTFGLSIYDVEELPTHGGSLRVYGCHTEDNRPVSRSVESVLEKEMDFHLREIQTYQNFQLKVNHIKDEFLSFLLDQKKSGKKVAGYGAAAKGSTLLNYAGVKPDLLPFICDAAPAKQGKFMPGSHIPILEPKKLTEQSIDYLIIFPWNISSEIIQNNFHMKEIGTTFVTFIPKMAYS
jgi:SAM-dependent methyltransferase